MALYTFQCFIIISSLYINCYLGTHKYCSLDGVIVIIICSLLTATLVGKDVRTVAVPLQHAQWQRPLLDKGHLCPLPI